MLKHTGAVALLLGLACLVQLTSCLELRLDDYLDLPKAAEFGEPLHRNARDALLALDIFKSTTSNDIMNQIEDRQNDNDENRRRVYRVLVNMKPHSRTPCSQDMTNLLKSLIAQIRAEPDGELSKKFSKFITEDFGREVITNCLLKFRSNFIAFQESNELDEFFIAGFELRGTIHETSNYQRNLELGNALRGADLSNEKLNAREMLKVVEKSLGKPSGSSSNSSLLEEFVGDKCQKLKMSYSTDLDNCNLATAIGEREILSPPVIKLNEYNRLCLAWSKPEKRGAILANILNQM